MTEVSKKKKIEKFIRLESISHSPQEIPLVSQEEFDKHRKILDWTFGFIVAIVVVCFTTFILLVWDVWKFHTETVRENSRIIQELRKENQESKFTNINKRLDDFEKLLTRQTETPTTPTVQSTKQNNKPKTHE